MNSNSYFKRHVGENFFIDAFIDPFNKRVRIDDYLGDFTEVMNEAEQLAVESNAEKLILKSRKEDCKRLLNNCYILEAFIDRYFLGSDAYLFAKFFRDERMAADDWLKEDQIMEGLSKISLTREPPALPDGYTLKKAGASTAESLASLYRQVFAVYPTPLHEPEYVKKTISEGTVYFALYHEGEIVSAASAEVNHFYKNAEMTDCATLKEHRKHGLMKILLLKLEEELVKDGIFHVFTMARALSFGMNAAFKQLGYSYTGRMLKNCFIYNKLEDMNVWTKNLTKKTFAEKPAH
ncbi:putative beta-lysine N-acetyltransferase [Bacillus canaveralius]|uniref:Beta-lysine N-acetyltransferase n=1 Tax=Bacillus canaveralius TaxID=1403243 RepID=A0A2N5GJ01_9BACI|nr:MULTISPECIES: putative beta-lysine N-acetyltransferase [Bacillus]PLR81036.1 putative beta-lysine N-acetyltransferase [Bacillus canaveralius]PLR82771.1 putative beta-lysine N-acetyltransferase [Bacillus sp. V33-4]PLR98990.1 putative beta-lysine N-acetyltransferase [Bacillus canaveralius]RSK45419.1 putative beta-lysine N-acetyltransferase [Bacillus canaveralius]